MKEFKPRRSILMIEILLYLVFANIALYFISDFVDSYLAVNIFDVMIFLFDLYCLYYIFVILTLKYFVDDNGILIDSLFGVRKIYISYDKVDGYNVSSGGIKGFKLSGFGRLRYALGKYIIDNMGVTNMFATSNRKIVYIHTKDMAYAVSPAEAKQFTDILKSQNIKVAVFKTKKNKNAEIYKDKKVFIPFIIETLVIIIMTLVPFVLYLNNMLPVSMPITFDSKFQPLIMGTGKNFAFKQMSYGVYNMIIMVCMYYASYFHAKYERKSAYKYMYISLAIALIFLLVQTRILIKFL
ncbi:MAG: PH domain-containing protein [Clostridiaceae bacterium]